MKRSGMIRRIIISLMIITFLSGTLGGMAEGILPSLTENTGIAMPSIAEALQRNPDSETENPDGSVTEYYANLSKQDYETFSVYLKEQGAALADYKMENNVLTAEIQANGASFLLTYDFSTGEATATYPAGTYGKKAQNAETEPAAEESKGDSTQIKKAGKPLTFGRYEQDNDPSNGPEAIEWLVLDYDKTNHKALLISKYGLDVRAYHEDGKVTWETCDLRKWLNSSFLNDAFSGEEQKAILLTEVDNSASQGYSGWGIPGGNNTEDQIFLLSYAEANLYFGVEVMGEETLIPRMAPTPYALARGAFTDGIRLTAEGIPAGHWWLRSPGIDPIEVADVIEFGNCQSKPVMVEECIRPAIWVNTESVEGLTEAIEAKSNQESADEEKTPVQEGNQENTAEETTEEKPDEAENKDAMASYKRPGSIVTFGTYEQDNDLTNGPEAIEWLVLDYDEKGNKALLLSKYGLDAQGYNLLRGEDTTWETCTLRTELNEAFLNTAFTAEEQSEILITEVDNGPAQGFSEWKTDGGNNTQDRIFLLSCAEASRYLDATYYDTSFKARTSATTYANERGGSIASGKGDQTADGETAVIWWLRSPGSKQCYAANISHDGALRDLEANLTHIVVRPALWLDLDAVERGPAPSAENNSREETTEENPDEAENEDAMASYKRAGSIVTFGAYEQDNDLTNGLEPIEWLVLTYDEKENKALLLSKYGLDTIGDLEDGITTWADCSQRRWLNEYFLFSAFSQEEREAVLITEVDDIEGLDHLAHEKGELQFAQDRVFLLSKREAAFYLGVTDISAYESQNVRARVAPTPYAIAQGAFVSDEFKTAEGLPAGSWLIRINRYDTKGCSVNEGGTTREDELEPKRGGGLPRVARPAVWLDLNALEGLLSSAEERKENNPKEAEREAKVSEYSKVGNVVTFGAYEQDNNLENGPEPIEWIVLAYDETNHRSMLISKYGLDTIFFDEGSTKTDRTWEDCRARKWLNQYFLYCAFSKEERKAIPVMEVDDSESQESLRHEKKELQNTQDQIFLLSCKEAEIYLHVTGTSPYDNKDTRARVAPTPYAIARGSFISDEFRTVENLPAGTWLLRTYAGDCQGMYVNESGTNNSSDLIRKRGGGEPHVARPVFWLDLDAAADVLLPPEEDQNHDENPAEAERKAKVAQYSRPGNIVIFGHYEQDNDPANGPEPIEWIVLTADDTTHRAMLVSKYGLDVLEYDNVHRFGQQLVWEICSAREWLNDTFLNTAFSKEEQKAIPMTELDNSDRINPKAKLKLELNNTQDRIFLLSKTEAEVYFNLDERNEQVETRVAPTPYAIARDAYISDMYQTAEGLSAGQWLLRTPSFDYFEGMVVFQDGKFERSNHKDKGSGNLTVARPAIWLDLDADIF